MSSMSKTTRILAGALGFGLLLTACAKVPHTGRIQYNLVPSSLMRGIGKTTYNSMLSGVEVTKKGANADTLQKVGRKISKVAHEPKFDWQFNLINEDTLNAWCLPGGYIGFYNGILPTLESEAGMAFVMGHEVGHATAHHGSERISQQLTLLGGLAGLEVYMANKTTLPPEQRAIILGALGVGAEVGVMLPFSRSHESEADVIGMMYMADAGYPPAESIQVWSRMAAASGGGSMPQFLSTHPTEESRQKNQREWLPKARKRYERNKLAYDTKVPIFGGGAAAPKKSKTKGG